MNLLSHKHCFARKPSVVLFPFSFGTPSLSAVCLDCILVQFNVSISGLSAPYISKSNPNGGNCLNSITVEELSSSLFSFTRFSTELCFCHSQIQLSGLCIC